jgi:hypothetical protein
MIHTPRSRASPEHYGIHSVGSQVFIALCYVRNPNTHPPRLVELIATAGAVDIDTSAPAITVMLPTED